MIKCLKVIMSKIRIYYSKKCKFLKSFLNLPKFDNAK